MKNSLDAIFSLQYVVVVGAFGVLGYLEQDIIENILRGGYTHEKGQGATVADCRIILKSPEE